MMEKFNNKPVFPVSPSYDPDGSLSTTGSIKYVKYLESNGAEVIMTTAGTSQFNLLSLAEIRELNISVCNNFKKIKIVGIPALSKRDLVAEIKFYDKHIEDKKDVVLLLLYPERFYDNETVSRYFSDVEKISDFNLMIHGKEIRKGTGGIKEYDADLLNHILAKTSKIIGMKEECGSFELGYDTIRKLPENFITIVAGKSIRRYEFLKKAGATTFLSGVGSFYPQFEVEYFSSKNRQDFLDIENNLFDTFMSIGWHKSMRNAIRYMKVGCEHDRQPFPTFSPQEKREIVSRLREVEEFLSSVEEAHDEA